MKVKSFRIRNYRSIKDSGVCYLSGDDITILAGKNESGKTAILEALEDFSVERQIREEARPIHDKEAIPEISVVFEMSKKELIQVISELGHKAKRAAPMDVEVIKRYPAEYSLSEKTVQPLTTSITSASERRQEKIAHLYRRAEETLSKIPQIDQNLPEMDLDTGKLLSRLRRFKRGIEQSLIQAADEEARDGFTKTLDELIDECKLIQNLKGTEKAFLDQIKQHIPNFILFSSFEDIFPSEIVFAEAANNELIKDLCTISSLNLDLVASGPVTEKMSHKEQLNVGLKEEYRKFWTQDMTNIHIDWDSEKLLFFIKEGDHFYQPRLRSKGRQWHLAFYVRVSAKAGEDRPNIILIDEPGLFLHAKAQKDILNKLEESADDAPIIYSTHSPYLIGIDKLSRVRLVSYTTGEGTRISNKIHKGADKETLTPIITAIGLDLSMGLDIAKDNNVIVEGISDYYYLSAFRQLLDFGFQREVHLIPCVGAGKSCLLAPLMLGWGLNYCVVLDNDREGRRTKAKLEKDFGHTGVEVVMVSQENDLEIEDLFERADFLEYVLNENSAQVPDSKRNSEIIKVKQSGYDKVLLSKLFYERVISTEVSLSEGTLNNFRSLLEKVDESMFPSEGSQKSQESA
jgi:predicted ATPase